ncbi:MAG: hypothetical protein H0V66_03410, partial [Bdellovibrionales bacterium]|nr:hypothetical protein [Bdellovibrionales bacterium]
SVYASEVRISYNPSNNLILSGKTCSSLITQHQAICNWQKLIDPSFVIPPIPETLCRRISDSNYSMTITSCLPSFVKANQHKKLYRSGANCWGTAMSFKKISTRPRFMWSNEISYWLNSPVCRKLNPGEEKKTGDLLNMYGPEYVFNKDEPNNKSNRFWEARFPGRFTPAAVEEGYTGYHHFLHTETFVTSDLTFGKDSPSKDDKFEFHEMGEVYGRPDAVECQENQSMTPYLRENQNPPRDIRNSKCSYFSLAYRCEAFPDYFARQTLSSSDQAILATVKSLQATQDKLFQLMTVLKHTLPRVEINVMLKQADHIAEKALEELSQQSMDQNHEMLLTLKYFTATGIRKSLELAALILPTEDL